MTKHAIPLSSSDCYMLDVMPAIFSTFHLSIRNLFSHFGSKTGFVRITNSVLAGPIIIGLALGLGTSNLSAQEAALVAGDEPPTDAELSQQVETVKRSALELNRDLLILEEELLFPSNTRLNVFLSMDVGYYFRLDSVKLSVDNEVVATHLYTDRQNYALNKGGVQRLYIGNLKQGEHEITAVFTGIGPNKREYKRGATTIVGKDRSAKALELQIRDEEDKQQPSFNFVEWETE